MKNDDGRLRMMISVTVSRELVLQGVNDDNPKQ